MITWKDSFLGVEASLPFGVSSRLYIKTLKLLSSFTFCLFLRKEGDDGEIRMRIRETCADFSQSVLRRVND